MFATLDLSITLFSFSFYSHVVEAKFEDLSMQFYFHLQGLLLHGTFVLFLI